MAEYRLSAAARTDIRSIFSFTRRKFGAHQAHVYIEGLSKTVQRLAGFPFMGRGADDLWPGMRKFGYESHVIFYTIDAEYIVVRRVLHAAMDFPQQFPSSE